MGSDLSLCQSFTKKFPASIFLSIDRKFCFPFPNTVICSFIVFLHTHFPGWRHSKDNYLSIVSNDKPKLFHVCHIEGILNSNCLSLDDVINYFSCHRIPERSNLWQEEFILALSLRDTVHCGEQCASVAREHAAAAGDMAPIRQQSVQNGNQIGLQLSKFTPWKLQLGPTADSSTHSQISTTNWYQQHTGF